MTKRKLVRGSPLNPIQPLIDVQGVTRFKENSIVQYVLKCAEKAGCDLNHLATLDFTRDDQEQFAQLIGYSLSGFSELGYVSNETIREAEASPVFTGVGDVVVTAHEQATRHLRDYIDRDLGGLADECRNLANVIERATKKPKAKP